MKLIRIGLFILTSLLVIFAISCSDTTEPAEETVSESAEPAAAKEESLDAVDKAESEVADAADVAPDVPEAPPVKKADEPKAKPPAEGPHPALLSPELANETAPARFRVVFETTKGQVVLEANRDWSPAGVDRLYNLVKIGYFNEVAFFRAIKGFMVQFGLSGDPKLNDVWRAANIRDEPVKASNKRSFMSYAMGGPNTRSTQFFINLEDNTGLDSQGFSPIARVVEGMSVVNSLYMGYGEGAPRGRGPSQQLIHSQGNKYLKGQFPELDYIQSAKILD